MKIHQFIIDSIKNESMDNRKYDPKFIFECPNGHAIIIRSTFTVTLRDRENGNFVNILIDDCGAYDITPFDPISGNDLPDIPYPPDWKEDEKEFVKDLLSELQSEIISWG